jgi:hypothetical protein
MFITSGNSFIFRALQRVSSVAIQSKVDEGVPKKMHEKVVILMDSAGQIECTCTIPIFDVTLNISSIALTDKNNSPLTLLRRRVAWERQV